MGVILCRVIKDFVLITQLPVINKIMERETRLELATICLEGRSSSQLSYSRNISGGERRIRTFEAVGGGFTVRRI